MGKGGQRGEKSSPRGDSLVSWDVVRTHNKRDDKWIVIDNQVYDITEWAKKHPGGSRVISHYAGQDATEAFTAFHNDLDHVKKYLKPIRVGHLDQAESQNAEMCKDMAELRETAKKMGLFKPSITFFVVVIAHILLLELAAYFSLYYFGTGWMPWIFSLLCYSTVQAQAGWTQHDFGHLSVFKSSRLNHFAHFFLMSFTKGASSDWWNHLHYQHHAKPNVMGKDPDVRIDAVFVVGDAMPKKVAKEKKNSMPYNHQHKYWFAIGPPLLFPVYFQFMIFKHVISRKKWLDLAIMLGFYVKFIYLYTGLLGFWNMLVYYFTMRVIESHWFVWVTQSNHIPMEIDEDKERLWLELQLTATCDVEKSFFNDWFTGHLNFQIEHHLFPTMPRHNLYKIQPLVRSLCEKHGIPYEVKPLGQAFADIVRTLKHSGQIWEAYYHAYHS